MKNKASVFLKHIITLLSSIAKAESLAIKSKTSAEKARLIYNVLIGEEQEGLDGHRVTQDPASPRPRSPRSTGGEGDQSKALVLYNAITNEYSHAVGTSTCMLRYNGQDEEGEDDDDDKYPDLRHSLFDENENFDDVKDGGSVIDLVKNSKAEGGNFKLEDEIDHVADLFINRFHKQMRLQKLLSLKRYQEMLDRSV